jgi:hypothetical protein
MSSAYSSHSSSLVVELTLHTPRSHTGWSDIVEPVPAFVALIDATILSHFANIR